MNIDITAAELAKCPLPNGGMYGAAIENPEHSLTCPVGTLLRITSPAEAHLDMWAVPQKGGDRDVHSTSYRKCDVLPDGRASFQFLVHQVGRTDIPLFHSAGNQVVRVFGVPDSRGRREMRQRLVATFALRVEAHRAK
jgi:hypothetical protein